MALSTVDENGNMIVLSDIIENVTEKDKKETKKYLRIEVKSFDEAKAIVSNYFGVVIWNNLKAETGENVKKAFPFNIKYWEEKEK